MIDLSTLSIPPVDVVPEPLPHEWEVFRRFKPVPFAIIDRVIYSLARRVRELEAEVERLHAHINKGMIRR